MLAFPIYNIAIVSVDDGDKAFGGSRPAPQSLDLNWVLLQHPLRGGTLAVRTVFDINIVPLDSLFNQKAINETSLLEIFAPDDDFYPIARHQATLEKPVP